MKKEILLLDKDFKVSAQSLADIDIYFMPLFLVNNICYWLYRLYKIEDIPEGYRLITQGYSLPFFSINKKIAQTFLPLYLLYFKELCLEHEYRFKKKHPSECLLELMETNIQDKPLLEDESLSLVFQLENNSIESNKKKYKSYYRFREKYTKRNLPTWLLEV